MERRCCGLRQLPGCWEPLPWAECYLAGSRLGGAEREGADAASSADGGGSGKLEAGQARGPAREGSPSRPQESLVWGRHTALCRAQYWASLLPACMADRGPEGRAELQVQGGASSTEGGHKPTPPGWETQAPKQPGASLSGIGGPCTVALAKDRNPALMRPLHVNREK